MSFDEKEVLVRFHRALVREIQTRNPEQISAPFTVAEIYQNLVPYRTHRSELGVEMNADYEHALLRLLSGEGDFLSIESKTARQEIRDELDSPNPNTGLYREFAAADVRLNPEKVDEALAAEVVGDASPTGPMEDGLPEEESMREEDEVELSLEGEPSEKDLEELKVEPVGASLVPPLDMEESGEEVDSQELPVEVTQEAEEETADLPPFENCPWCREALPQQARVRFCPFCGSNVQLVPCPSCGEELRINWRFCIACGTEVDS